MKDYLAPGTGQRFGPGKKSESMPEASSPSSTPGENAPFQTRSESADSFQKYLSEISKTPLLTREEEHALALRVRAGDQAARECLIKSNLRLVIKIARDYEHFGVPLLDLISEGNIGLMKAVDRFDPTQGASICTYSSFWIKQRIKRALANQGKTIRLPVHVVGKLAQYRRIEMLLETLLGRSPTNEELADECGCRLDKMESLRSISTQTTSLDQATFDEEHNLGDVIADESVTPASNLLDDEAQKKHLARVLKSLSPREYDVLQARFGINQVRERTLDEVASTYSLSKERIRQIQNKAINKLRHLMERYFERGEAAT